MKAASPSALSSNSPSPKSQRAKLPQAGPPTKTARRRMDKQLAQFKSAHPLQRGSACLNCRMLLMLNVVPRRKRKMVPDSHPPPPQKCDAGKPACAQCVKANRAGDCDYDDGKSKSRTQLLQEKIVSLENRLRELESVPANPSAAPPPPHFSPSPAVSASSFYSGVGDGMIGASGSTSSFELTALSANGSPTPGSPDSGWMCDQYNLQLAAHNNSSRVGTPEDLPWDVDMMSVTPNDLLKVSGRSLEAEMLPPRISQLLINIFLPHRHQCGFEVNSSRFQASINSADPPHPALLNAIYALACHFSMSPILSPHETRFVGRALKSISAALEASDRLVHVVQASCLLAILFFAKGRLLEGYYHAGAASRLAVGLGLHQISMPPEWSSPEGSPGSSASSSWSHSPGGSSVLPPPVNNVELGERILTFWQVFNLDRCWAVATGLPVALTEDKHSRTRIETPWPRALEEYEVGYVQDSDNLSINSLCSPYSSVPYSPQDSLHTLRAKATTLFERAGRLSSSFGDSPQVTEEFWVDFQNLDATISRLLVNLPSVRLSMDDPQHHGHPQPRPRVNTSIFVIHSLLHAAIIQLHSLLAFKDAASQQRSAAVAALAASMVHDLDETDYAFLDPIMGTCWTSVAEALLRELIVDGSTPAMGQQVAHLNRQLDAVVMAMTHLGTTVPLAAYQASKVEQSRLISY
ncbi:hypothetical protein BU17DRAFT_61477 [Hysterangium stoloniferum]|nr:hypothetical protein BU17DRAFT_61477 [Hysterangium stoloniferum]